MVKMIRPIQVSAESLLSFMICPFPNVLMNILLTKDQTTQPVEMARRYCLSERSIIGNGCVVAAFRHGGAIGTAGGTTAHNSCHVGLTGDEVSALDNQWRIGRQTKEAGLRDNQDQRVHDAMCGGTWGAVEEIQRDPLNSGLSEENVILDQNTDTIAIHRHSMFIHSRLKRQWSVLL